MIFYYIRHGDPIYVPDSLTPLGKRQAEAVAKRLSLYGVDKIYTSSSNRAIQTAQPTCEIVKKEAEILDFANEVHAWNELVVCRPDGSGKLWAFQHKETKELFCSPEIKALGDQWYEHPKFKNYRFKQGIERIYRESDEFFKSLGYEHIRYTGKYKVIHPNNERVALFAHQGFGLAFLSCLLDIPYPLFSTRFDICHTGLTVIEFKEIDGYTIPQILTHSSDSHLYKEGLPTNYNHCLRF